MNTVDEFLLDSNSFPELNKDTTKKRSDLYVDSKSLQHGWQADI